MINKKHLLIFTIGTVILLMPIAFFMMYFCLDTVHFENETIEQLGSFLSKISVPIIALASVSVTLLLGIISDFRNKANIKIDQQKQRPLLHIDYRDSEDNLFITMKNKGNGPLLIETFSVFNKENKDITGIYFCLPEITNKYDDYTGNQDGTVIAAGEEVVLLHFLFDKNKNGDKYLEELFQIRQSLKDLIIKVRYTDVFDNEMPLYQRKLTWFGREPIVNKKEA